MIHLSNTKLQRIKMINSREINEINFLKLLLIIISSYLIQNIVILNSLKYHSFFTLQMNATSLNLSNPVKQGDA